MTINKIIGNKERTSRIDTDLWKKMNETYSRIENNTKNNSKNNTIKNLANNKIIINIDEILKGEIFFNINISIALEQALEYTTPKGYIATMPELIAAKIKAEKTHDFWKNIYTVHTEENIGIDKKGLFYKKNEPVLVIVNGGGILTSEKVKKAYTKGLIEGRIEYANDKFDNLLEEKLPDNSRIKLYSFEKIKKGISNLPHQFGVVTPYKLVKETYSGYHKKDKFITNPLVIARAGGIENLEKYFELAKDEDEGLGCYHSFRSQYALTPSGYLLYLSNRSNGLNYNNLIIDYGRFIGVRIGYIISKK